MNTKHPIDELFRNNLENHEPPFREEDWKEAAQLLDKNPLTAIAGNFWKWFGIISAFVLICGLAGFYFVMNQQDKTTASTAALPANTTLITSQNNAQQSSDKPESSEMILNPSNEKQEAREQSHIKDPAIVSTSAPGISETIIESSSLPGNNNKKIISQKHDATKSSVIIDTKSAATISENISVPSKNISANKKSSIELKINNGEIVTAPASDNSENNSPAEKIMSSPAGNSSDMMPVTTSGSADEKISKGNASFPATGNTAIKNSHTLPVTRSTTELQLIPLRDISLDHPFIDENLSPINFNPVVSNNFLHQHHWSPFTSLEASLTGGATLISVPQIKSVQPGIEWNALLNYRLNNFIAGTGMGQFSVKEKFELSTDSITMSSYEVPVITVVDSFWVYDSTIVVIDSIPILVFDSSYYYISDTTLQLITTSDTSTTTATYASSGSYLEIPLILGYRFNWLNCRWQISGGAAYGWYHGGKRFGFDSEGKIFSYEPGPVVSFIARAGIQYPLAEKIFLQGYLGGRYVMGLNSNQEANNYLIYSAGGGILFRF